MARTFEHVTNRHDGVLRLTMRGAAMIETAAQVHGVFATLSRARVHRVELDATGIDHADITFLQLLHALRASLHRRDIDVSPITAGSCVDGLARAAGFIWDSPATSNQES